MLVSSSSSEEGRKRKEGNLLLVYLNSIFCGESTEFSDGEGAAGSSRIHIEKERGMSETSCWFFPFTHSFQLTIRAAILKLEWGKGRNKFGRNGK